MTTPSPLMSVRLREATVALLMKLREGDGETLDAVVARLASVAAVLAPPPVPVGEFRTRRPPTVSRDKYAVVMLGETIHAATLGRLFAGVVDALVMVDPSSIDRLATMRARKRFFVARDRTAIHPGRPDLEVYRTISGWWVSANIGKADIDRGLRAVCKASGLDYGGDVRFVGRSGGS